MISDDQTHPSCSTDVHGHVANSCSHLAAASTLIEVIELQ